MQLIVKYAILVQTYNMLILDIYIYIYIYTCVGYSRNLEIKARKYGSVGEKKYEDQLNKLGKFSNGRIDILDTYMTQRILYRKISQ